MRGPLPLSVLNKNKRRIKREFGNKTDGNCRERNTAGARVDMRTTAALIVVIVFRPLCLSLNRKCLPLVGSLLSCWTRGIYADENDRRPLGHLTAFCSEQWPASSTQTNKVKSGQRPVGRLIYAPLFPRRCSFIFFSIVGPMRRVFPFFSNRPPT